MYIQPALRRTFLIAALFCLCALSGCSKNSTSANDDNQLEYIVPEEVGYSSEALDQVKEVAEQSGYAAMLALYDGKVFFSWGNISQNYWCHSIRKPFLGALYGIQIEEGNIDLDETLEELGIDDIPPGLTNEEKQATVRDLLMSRSGVYHEAAAEDATMIATRPARGSHDPGTFYYYNNWDFNALGTILEEQTGADIFEEFKDKIADPIGMQDFSVDSCFYQYELNKSEHPAYSFRMSARDMARFGVLYQKDGLWKNTRIIPSDWIDKSTTAYSIVDSASGIAYGYLWRVFPEDSELANMIGSPGYYHTGVGIHILIVVPDLKLVLVQRYDTDGDWEDPGDIGMQMGLMIVNARISAN